MNWKSYRKKSVTEMRSYVPGESMEGVSVSPGDHPVTGGMIARNSEDHSDQWYISPEFFDQNYVELPR